MSPPLHLDSLSDDVLGKILRFCDFASASALTSSTSARLRERFAEPTWSDVLWRPLYERQGFVPDYPSRKQDFFKSCQRQRRLQTNLMVPWSKKGSNTRRLRPFSLPHRRFSFIPITPKSDEYADFSWQDPPPVFYECDSFALTCGTSSEMLFLDPFDGSLSILKDIKERVVLCSDTTSMMDWVSTSSAHQQTDTARAMDGITPQTRGLNSGDGDTTMQDETGAAAQSTQCLLPGNEHFDLDLREFFPYYQHTDREEFEMSFAGTESKPIWSVNVEKGSVQELQGNMVAVCRCVTSLDNGSGICTELSTWMRSATDTEYGHRQVCRFPGCFRQMELDACHGRLFVSFIFAGDETSAGVCPRTIIVLPLVDWERPRGGDDDPRLDNQRYFPRELFSIQCQHPVATFGLDATGQTILVATHRGTLEVWKLNKSTASRQSVVSLVGVLTESIGAELSRRVRVDPSGHTQTETPSRFHSHPSQQLSRSEEHRPHNVDEELHDRFSVLRRQPELPQFHHPIQDIFLTKHRGPEHGFVTLHHAPQHGSSLLLWKNFKIVSLIHLRLSSRRKPRIYFDGNRILVFGEDHIGSIILVYQVLGPEFQGLSEQASTSGEASGGVYHLCEPPAVRFANRIRHVALGGIEGLDSMHMTCNDRFILANTRTGNHLGSSPCPEGLLLIDLQDE